MRKEGRAICVKCLRGLKAGAKKIGKEIGKEIGEKIGREEQAKATAARMQKKGFSTYEIAEFIGFGREQVEKWLKENNA